MKKEKTKKKTVKQNIIRVAANKNEKYHTVFIRKRANKTRYSENKAN